MNEGILALLIPFVAIPLGCATTVLLAMLIFPSTRGALARWLHRRADPGLDEGSVAAQLATTNAQLAALRGEVYALRCEVAAVSQALPAAVRPAALSAPPQH